MSLVVRAAGAAFVAALAVAAPAQAAPSWTAQDYQFFDDLKGFHVKVYDVEKMITLGHAVCADLGSGSTWQSTTDYFTNTGATYAEAQAILAASTMNYCPQWLDGQQTKPMSLR